MESKSQGTPQDVEASTPDFLYVEQVDAQRIQNAISETGTNALGIMAIDIWILNDDDGRLYHFGERGLNWVNPVFRKQLEDDDKITDRIEKLGILDRLDDSSNSDCYHPIPHPSGFGYAGNYWQQFGDMAGSARGFEDPLVWRETRAFITDPDQMSNERMHAIDKVFGKLTGVPFNIFGESKGVVMFHARGTAEERNINTRANSNFLRLASYNIGSALAMSHSRARIMQSRQQLAKKLFRKARVAFQVTHSFNIVATESRLRKNGSATDPKLQSRTRRSLSDQTNIPKSLRHTVRMVQNASVSFASYVKAKAKSVKVKTLHPPDIKPPLGSSLFVSSYSFTCSFLALITIFGFEWLIDIASGGKYSLTLPPLGALMTLQYSLTGAPASQPRNSVLGIVLSISVVMSNKILLYHVAGLPRWLHASLGTSLAIFVMQILGVVHPPAAACAFIFALSGRTIGLDFLHACLYLSADILCVGLAIIFNNFSDTRQYPMYWQLNPFCKK